MVNSISSLGFDADAAARGAEVRHRLRRGGLAAHTSGLADDLVQANLVILPSDVAHDLLLFCQHNPRPCPVLAVGDTGSPTLPSLAADLDLCTDLPRYRVWRDGELVDEPGDITGLWRDDLVAFAIGCSFSFEWAMQSEGIPIRHIEQGCNVPMYRTNIPTRVAGVFSGPMVVSMRPLAAADALRAVQITSRFPAVHGAPVHLGDLSQIGVADLGVPDHGDPVRVAPGEIPVIWACGVTPQAALRQARPRFCITHAHSSNTFQTKNLEQFAADVKAATGDKLLITVHSGGALFKQPEIKRAIQTGLAPAGEFIISGLANENPACGADSIPFLATSYADAKRLYEAAKAVQAKVLAAQGMKVLFSVPWPGQSLYSVKPIDKAEDFKGTTMRAYNPATTKIAQMPGASPVTIQLPELGQALATGATNNFLTSSASGADSKLYEQVKFFYPVNGWLPRNVTAVSQKSFDALDKATQDAVRKAAADAEARGWKASEKVDTGSIKILADNGVKVAPPSASVKAALEKIGEQMTADWLASAGPDGKTIIDAYRKQ